MSLFQIGKKVLINTDQWFCAPDGKQYKAVHGTVRALKSDHEALGIKTNARSTNWYVEIGDMLIAGCQIHYAIAAETADFGEVEHWQEHEGECRRYMAPSRIYNADGGNHE